MTLYSSILKSTSSSISCLHLFTMFILCLGSISVSAQQQTVIKKLLTVEKDIPSVASSTDAPVAIDDFQSEYVLPATQSGKSTLDALDSPVANKQFMLVDPATDTFQSLAEEDFQIQDMPTLGAAKKKAIDQRRGSRSSASTDTDGDGIADSLDLCPDYMDTALDFDGIDDYVTVPHNPALNVGGGDFTFEAWLNPAGTGIHTILAKGAGSPGGTNFLFEISTFSGDYYLRLFYAGGLIGNSTAISLNEWNHVAVSFNFTSKQAIFYVNGVADGMGSFPNPPNISGTDSLIIGKNGLNGTSNVYEGRMDDVSIWNTVRTASEIAEDMTNVDMFATGLVISYDMNESAACLDNTSTTTILDQSQNNFGGLLNNFSLLPGCTSNWTSGRNLDSDQNGLGDGCDFGCSTGMSVLYVDSSAISGNNLGTSWADAYVSLSEALIHAELCPDIDSIHVATGTYVPHPGGLANLRNASFVILDSVHLLGQFPSGGGDLLSRDTLHQTILSGDIGIVADDLDNVYHVMVATNISSQSSVDGFIITKGFADGGGSDNNGAGLYNHTASPGIRNCIFIDNHAIGLGGGFYGVSDSVSLQDCQFISNTASVQGGGAYLQAAPSHFQNVSFTSNTSDHGGGISGRNASISLIDCQFNMNSVVGYGGGGLYLQMAPSSLQNVSFTGNTSSSSGGGFFSENALVSLEDCQFSMNMATSFGGGVMVPWATLHAQNVSFTGNSATTGGGLYCQHDSVSLVDCQFSANTALGTGGGVSLFATPLSVQNTVFTSNSSNSGGGINTQNASIALIDCQFNMNMAANFGGGVQLLNAPLVAQNVVFNNNSSNNAGGGLHSRLKPISLTNCQFNGNAATNEGGGLHLSSSPLVAQNVLFTSDSSSFGGGLYSNNAAVSLLDCQFSANIATTYGGGVGLLSAPLTAQNVTFNNNSSDYAGGGLYSETASVSLIDCEFDLNMAANFGGGGCLITAPLTAQNVMFTSNSSSLTGGGLYSQDASTSLLECQFRGNTAGSDGGGVAVDNPAASQVKNCTFVFNESNAGNGGAYQVAGTGQTDFVNCLFARNQALGSGAQGGGAIMVFGGVVDITNSTIVNNYSARHGGVISIFDATGSASVTNTVLWNNAAPTDSIIYNGNGGSASMNYSLMNADNCLPNVTCGSGMIYNQDPLFVFLPAVPTVLGDLRVQVNSPAINAGFNDSIPPDCTTDLNGLYRFFDGTVDIGAYEFGDSDADGIPNSIDLCPDNMDTALDFDGTDDHIVVPHHAALNVGDGDFTFQAWVYPTAQGWSTILSKGTGIFGTSNYYFSINPSMVLGLSMENQTQYSATAIPLYAWSHVAVSFDFSTKQATFYLNGLADGVGSYPNAPPSDTNPLFIGQQGYDCACNRFEGRLDDVSIWNTTRTPSDLAIDMASGVDASQTGLLVSYDMNETAACIDNSSITMITDQSPNGFGGVLTNFSLLPGCTSNWSSGRNLDSDQDGLGDGCDYRCNTGLTVLYVDSSAIGGNNLGNAWADAYLSLSAALRYAEQCSDIDSILVAAGTYVPDVGGLANQRKTSFVIPQDVQILGQFPAGGGDLSARDTLFQTILSGDIGFIGDSLDNVYHVVIDTNMTSESSVDGFIVTKGFANGGGDDDNGAGYFNINASPGISNCAFIDNHAIGYGGGLYSIGDSLSLLDCQFTLNRASERGGGVYLQSAPSHFQNVRFTSNQANDLGGGLYSVDATVSLMDCQFVLNMALQRGGGAFLDIAPTIAQNVTFTLNSANDLAGGLFCALGPVSLLDCQFNMNVTSGFGGGGLYAVSAPISAQNVSFTGNTANNAGGGLYSDNALVSLIDCQFNMNMASSFGGGALVQYGPLTAQNVSFTDNAAATGGGLYSRSDSVSLINCQYSMNTAIQRGGGIALFEASLDARNVVFTDNSCNNVGGGLDAYDSSISLLDCQFSANTATAAGGLRVFNPGVSQVKNCIFRFNQAHDGDTQGAGGAFQSEGPGQTDFVNCLFEANQALGSGDNGGGALMIYAGSVNMINSTIVNNHSATHGGAISIFDNSAVATITNAILWNNSATTDSTIYNGNGGLVFANYCLFDAINCLPNVSCGIGMVYDQDPPFINMVSTPPSSGDFRLRYGSPAINSGINGSIPSGVTTDLNGLNRILNTTVDMGAYEFNYEFPCGIYGNLTIDDTPVFMGDYKASGLISSEGIINTNSNGPVSFKSENEIELNQGFEVKLGEVFNAVIEDPCVD